MLSFVFTLVLFQRQSFKNSRSVTILRASYMHTLFSRSITRVTFLSVHSSHGLAFICFILLVIIRVYVYLINIRLSSLLVTTLLLYLRARYNYLVLL